MKTPKRGEVYLANLDPTIGTEIRKTRPVLIVQNDTYNKYDSTTVVAPITSTVKNLGPSKVLVASPKGGLNMESVILLKQIRAIDKRRLVKKLGTLEKQTVQAVDRAIMICLGLRFH